MQRNTFLPEEVLQFLKEGGFLFYVVALGRLEGVLGRRTRGCLSLEDLLQNGQLDESIRVVTELLQLADQAGLFFTCLEVELAEEYLLEVVA